MRGVAATVLARRRNVDKAAKFIVVDLQGGIFLKKILNGEYKHRMRRVNDVLEKAKWFQRSDEEKNVNTDASNECGGGLYDVLRKRK